MLIRNPASSREFHAVSLRSTIISFVIDDEKYDMQPATFHISCWRFMQLMFCAANERQSSAGMYACNSYVLQLFVS